MKLSSFISICSSTLVLFGMNVEDSLILAIRTGNIQEVQTLINQPNFNVNKAIATTVDYNYTPLAFAICYHQKNIIDLLLSAGADSTLPIAKISDNYYDALTLAICSNQVDTVHTIINTHDHRANWLALISAIDKEKENIIKMLINANLNINLQNPRGTTALMRAITKTNVELVKLLLQAGADFSLADVNEQTAFTIAQQEYTSQVLPSKKKKRYQQIGKILLDLYITQKQLCRIKHALTQYFQKYQIPQDSIDRIFSYAQLSFTRYDRLISTDLSNSTDITKYAMQLGNLDLSITIDRNYQAKQTQKQKCSIQ